MKSIEEKAKAYDKALVIARSRYNIETEESVRICLELMFPELKESEDEKIRKDIVEAVELHKDFTQERKEHIYAWLEKQGEQPKKHDVCDYCDQQGCCVSPCPMKLVEKHGEHYMGISEATKQKLEDNLNKALEKETPESCNEFLDEQGEQKQELLTKEKALKNSPFVEQKPAWSEEDKNMAHYIGNAITTDEASNYLKEKDIEVIDAHVWLESLKRRVQLQPKQEWSEDDERYLNNTISYLKDATEFKETAKLCIDWLKSLSPQNTWKPSDEQMKALEEATNKQWDVDGDALWHLYQDLKKLRED